MFNPKLAALFTLLAPTATAGSFSMTEFVASDKHKGKKEEHSISFTVAPDFEQAGYYWPHKCAIKWLVEASSNCYLISILQSMQLTKQENTGKARQPPPVTARARTRNPPHSIRASYQRLSSAPVSSPWRY